MADAEHDTAGKKRGGANAHQHRGHDPRRLLTRRTGPLARIFIGVVQTQPQDARRGADEHQSSACGDLGFSWCGNWFECKRMTGRREQSGRRDKRNDTRPSERSRTNRYALGVQAFH